LSVDASRRGRLSGDLAWLVDLLWGPAVETGQVRVRADAEVPDGFVEVERFAVVPSLARPRFLVPLASRRAAWASTSRYNALRPARMRALRAAVGTGMRVGVGQRALRDRLTVSVAAGLGQDRREELLIGAHLRRQLDAPDLVMGIGVREPQPNRKPTLQLFGAGGEAAGYVKVGWSRLTRALVRNEAEALRACQAHPPAGLGIPRLLLAGAWGGLDLAVTSPLPTGVRRHRRALRPPPVTVSQRIAAMEGTRVLPLRPSLWWLAVRRRIAETAAADGEIATTLRRCADEIERRHGAEPLVFGRWHGDWVPWNLAWEHGRLHAWDWEHSGPDAPLGFDLLHWQFQVAFVGQRRDAAEAAARCAELAAPDLVRLGLGPAAVRALPRLYLLEMYLRGYGMQAAGAGWNPRFHPRMLQVLAGRGER
jgi:hypothetical protein